MKGHIIFDSSRTCAHCLPRVYDQQQPLPRVRCKRVGLRKTRAGPRTDLSKNNPSSAPFRHLDHHTLGVAANIAEAMPACLSDRIVEERRKEREDGEALSSGRPEKEGMSLAGAFLFIRGAFYVTKATPGEASET